MEDEDDQIYIPQVRVDLKPRLNQQFETIKDVAIFYNIYAKDAGFSTRSHTSARVRMVPYS